MHDPKDTDGAFGSRDEGRLLDVLIRAGLILALAMLCFQIFSRFLILMDAPMPVILLGALGGMAAAGILGLFVGATMLALGYQIFMGWVAPNPVARQTAGDASETAAD
jgi:hypothetical protein